MKSLYKQVKISGPRGSVPVMGQQGRISKHFHATLSFYQVKIFDRSTNSSSNYTNDTHKYHHINICTAWPAFIIETLLCINCSHPVRSDTKIVNDFDPKARSLIVMSIFLGFHVLSNPTTRLTSDISHLVWEEGVGWLHFETARLN